MSLCQNRGGYIKKNTIAKSSSNIQCSYLCNNKHLMNTPKKKEITIKKDLFSHVQTNENIIESYIENWKNIDINQTSPFKNKNRSSDLVKTENSKNVKLKDYLNDLDNLLSDYHKKDQESIQNLKKTMVNSKENIENTKIIMKNKPNEINEKSILLLKSKYIPIDNIKKNCDIEYGEILCFNCEEFVDLNEMNEHSKICEFISEDKDLLLINYKLEKIKTTLLININETNHSKLHLIIQIIIKCIQKTINCNIKSEIFLDIIKDENELLNKIEQIEFYKTRVYQILTKRILYLTNLKNEILNYELKFEKTESSNISLKTSIFFNEEINKNKRKSIIDKKNSIDYNNNIDILDFENIKKSNIFSPLEINTKNKEILNCEPIQLKFSPLTIKSENRRKSENKLDSSFNEIKKKKNEIFDINKYKINKENENPSKNETARKKRFDLVFNKIKNNYVTADMKNISSERFFKECQQNQIHEMNWEIYLINTLRNVY